MSQLPRPTAKTMDIIYVDEEMTVVLELNFTKVVIKEKDGVMKNEAV